MVTRRLLPLTIMPMMGLPRDAGVAAAGHGATARPPSLRRSGWQLHCL
jgi:hypothetical protein